MHCRKTHAPRHYIQSKVWVVFECAHVRKWQWFQSCFWTNIVHRKLLNLIACIISLKSRPLGKQMMDHDTLYWESIIHLWRFVKYIHAILRWMSMIYNDRMFQRWMLLICNRCPGARQASGQQLPPCRLDYDNSVALSYHVATESTMQPFNK